MFSARLCSHAALLAAATLCGALAACVSGSDEAPKPGAARFGALLENPKWYRAFDSTSNIATETPLVVSKACWRVLNSPFSYMRATIS
jgi:hypothetical protein